MPPPLPVLGSGRWCAALYGGTLSVGRPPLQLLADTVGCSTLSFAALSHPCNSLPLLLYFRGLSLLSAPVCWEGRGLLLDAAGQPAIGLNDWRHASSPFVGSSSCYMCWPYGLWV